MKQILATLLLFFSLSMGAQTTVVTGPKKKQHTTAVDVNKRKAEADAAAKKRAADEAAAAKKKAEQARLEQVRQENLRKEREEQARQEQLRREQVQREEQSRQEQLRKERIQQTRNEMGIGWTLNETFIIKGVSVYKNGQWASIPMGHQGRLEIRDDSNDTKRYINAIVAGVPNANEGFIVTKWGNDQVEKGDVKTDIKCTAISDSSEVSCILVVSSNDNGQFVCTINGVTYSFSLSGCKSYCDSRLAFHIVFG